MKNIKSYALIAALAFGLAACGANTDTGSAETKTGTAETEGYGGTIKVTVTMEGDTITNIERESTDTDNVGEVAMDELTEKMKEENTADVESVSGATVSSDAFKEAVKTAIENAK